ncbi:MAG: hypothetical protein IH793_03405, partial [Acidobacteria bacterium]|nr:hypothetical protein [Acidobacteriota bacterium]
MSRQLASILEKAGLLAEEDLATALSQAQESKRSLWEIILTENNVSEEKLAEALAAHLRIPYIRLAAAIIDPDAVRLVSEELARKFLCLPLKVEGEETNTIAGGP